MPRCAWCEQIKPVDAFRKMYAGMLQVICLQCEKQPLTYCGFCGLPVHAGWFYKISDRLNECLDCHEQTLATIRKNELIRTQWKINQIIKQTNRMSEQLKDPAPLGQEGGRSLRRLAGCLPAHPSLRTNGRDRVMDREAETPDTPPRPEHW